MAAEFRGENTGNESPSLFTRGYGQNFADITLLHNLKVKGFNGFHFNHRIACVTQAVSGFGESGLLR